MKREDLLKKEVIDIKLDKNQKVSNLVEQFGNAGGFSAKNVAIAADILKEMFKEKDCKRFLSFPACIISTGLRGVIADALRKKLFDVVITTCGTLDHDLARAFGGKYYAGAFELDDSSLRKIGVNRLGNVLVPNESYGIILEKKMRPILEKLIKEKEEWGGRELIAAFGKHIKDEDSIVYQAYKNDIPIYCPGITDGAFGTNLTLFSQNNKFKLNILKDELELADIAFKAKKTGALIIGGGISKHHVIWWAQFANGLDYVVYITTAQEYDGSLSGARTREAISWGKLKEKARQVTVDGDATVLLPLIMASVYDK